MAMDCPPKVKHFLWWLCHNRLAVRRILKRRGMELIHVGGHLLLKCKEVKQVWSELNLESVRCWLIEATSLIQMMERVMDLEEKQKLTVIMLLWLWWEETNSFREEGTRRSAMEVAFITALQADKFQTTRSSALNQEGSVPEIHQTHRWLKPAKEVLKINSDRTFKCKERTGGWGFVIRDDQGAVVKAGAAAEHYITDAFHAELLGFLAGLKEAARMGIAQVCIETDATMMKEAVVGEDYRLRLSKMGGVITHLVASEFVSCSISVCHHLCNKVAHAIAALGCNCPSESGITWDDVPQGVEDLVLSDLAEAYE